MLGSSTLEFDVDPAPCRSRPGVGTCDGCDFLPPGPTSGPISGWPTSRPCAGLEARLRRAGAGHLDPPRPYQVPRRPRHARVHRPPRAPRGPAPLAGEGRPRGAGPDPLPPRVPEPHADQLRVQLLVFDARIALFDLAPDTGSTRRSPQGGRVESPDVVAPARDRAGLAEQLAAMRQNGLFDAASYSPDSAMRRPWSGSLACSATGAPRSSSSSPPRPNADDAWSLARPCSPSRNPSAVPSAPKPRQSSTSARYMPDDLFFDLSHLDAPGSDAFTRRLARTLADLPAFRASLQHRSVAVTGPREVPVASRSEGKRPGGTGGSFPPSVRGPITSGGKSHHCHLPGGDSHRGAWNGACPRDLGVNPSLRCQPRRCGPCA